MTPSYLNVTLGDMITAAVSHQRRPYRMAARAEAARATGERVLDVALELFTGKPYDEVSLEEIAARANVTKRTVLRRFGSKESLFLAANERSGLEEMRRRNEAPVGDVAAGVSVVIDSYERFGANRLRVLAQEDRIPVVAHDVAIGRELHRSWVRRTFAPLIAPLTGAARRRRIAVLVALTDVYIWKLLRHDLGLTRADTERVLAELIDKLEGER